MKIRTACNIDANNAYRIEFNDGDTIVVHTNENGRGLWEDGKQIEGTSQFNLNVSDKISKLRRYFSWRD